MAALFGIFVAKLLSIAGVGGLIAGLFQRNWLYALAAGSIFGVVDTLVLASMRYTGVAPIGWIMAIFVGALMAALGWWIRGRKAAR